MEVNHAQIADQFNLDLNDEPDRTIYQLAVKEARYRGENVPTQQDVDRAVETFMEVLESDEEEDLDVELPSSYDEKYENINVRDLLSNEEYKQDESDPIDRARQVQPINLDPYPSLKGGDGKTVAGVDPARYGDDRTAILIRMGIHVVDILSYEKRDTMETTGIMMNLLEAYYLDSMVIDITGGLGAGVYDRLRELNVERTCRLVGVESQSSPRRKKSKAVNQRSEMYMNLQEIVREGNFSIPHAYEPLVEELVHITYKVESTGKIRILDKGDIKRTLGRSPDLADACALCFYNKPEVRMYL